MYLFLYGDNYEEHKVKVNEGDSISTIAFDNEISVDEFLISNQHPVYIQFRLILILYIHNNVFALP